MGGREGKFFHKVYVYLVTMMYTLNIYNFICQLYLRKFEKMLEHDVKKKL